MIFLCYSVKSHLADSFLVRSILKNRCVIVDVLYSNRHRRGNLRRSHIRKKSTERKIYIDFHTSKANMMLSQLFLTQICLFSPALYMFYIFLLYFSAFLLLLLSYFRSLRIDCSSTPIFNHILVSLFSSMGYVRLFVSLFCSL